MMLCNNVSDFIVTGIFKTKMQSNMKFINFGKTSLNMILKRHIINVTYSTVIYIYIYI